MKIPQEELISLLLPFNPWWRNETIPDLPSWKRSPYSELITWATNPPTHRAVMLSGPRQVGKTTLLLQTVNQLLANGVPPANILYATFDHPVFKLAGLDAVLEAWRELEPKKEGTEYLFLDEAQFVKDFGTWVKHQNDFLKKRRVFFTGSAMPLLTLGEESGVGRWHTIPITTLSFYEYLQLKKIPLPNLPKITHLHELSETAKSTLLYTEAAQSLIGHFHEYLIQGGFPQVALIESITQAQKLLREDIIDKVLKRDMTAQFGVRRVLELEQTFIYLCMHQSGIQDIGSLSSNLGVTRPTVSNFISHLEDTYLLYKLPPYGNGKEILKPRYKLYLADPSIAPAVLMKGKTILEDPAKLGNSVETAVFSHLKAHSNSNHARFCYWKDKNDREVDLIIELGEKTIPLEVKYESVINPKDFPALLNFCRSKKNVSYGYVITKAAKDIGPLETELLDKKIIRIPACLFCYWLGESEILQRNIL